MEASLSQSQSPHGISEEQEASRESAGKQQQHQKSLSCGAESGGVLAHKQCVALLHT